MEVRKYAEQTPSIGLRHPSLEEGAGKMGLQVSVDFEPPGN